MERNLRYLVILSFLMMIVFFGLFKIVSFDFGWHLKAGEYICVNKSIPHRDIFSYIAQGNQWVDSHWLFQVLLYLSYAVAGATGSIILRIIVLVLTFGFLFFTIYRQKYYPVSFLICLAALFMSFQRFLLRPEIFTFLFLALFFYFTENFSRLSLFIIPVAQVLWANMHGLHVLGIVFLMLYLLGDLVQAVACKYIPIMPKVEIKTQEWKQKGLLFALTCLALLVNANGLDGIFYPYKIFAELKTKPVIFSMVAELISPLTIKHAVFPAPSLIYKIFLPLSILVLLCQLKRTRLAHLFPYGAFLYLSLLAIRNVPLFAIVATPITIRNVYGILDFWRSKKGLPHIRPLVPALGCCLFFLAIGWFIATNGLYQRLHYLRSFGFGVSDNYPTQAVNYLKGKDIKDGNIFNSSDIGGYLIWQMYPEKQVALDGRWEVYGDFLENIKRLAEPGYFEELINKYNIKFIILYKRSWEIRLMSRWLPISPFWDLTKETANAAVYERISDFPRLSTEY